MQTVELKSVGNFKAFAMTFALAVCLLAHPAVAGALEDAEFQMLMRHYDIAFKIYMSLANNGDARGQTGLASMYRFGEGVHQDYAMAANWYRKAAEQGDGGGQHYLGVMYRLGQGVPQDYVFAHMWLNLAAANPSGGLRTVGADIDRDDLAKKMTHDQIAEAQRLAREWTAAHPHN